MVDVNPDQEIIRDLSYNKELRNFFAEFKHVFDQIGTKDLPDGFVRSFVHRLLVTCVCKDSWKDYASEFQRDYEPPVCFDKTFVDEVCSTIKAPSKRAQKTFSDVINILLHHKRFDVLRRIKESSFVNDLIHGSHRDDFLGFGVSFSGKNVTTTDLVVKSSVARVALPPKITNQISVFIPHSEDALDKVSELAQKITEEDSNICVVPLFDVKIYDLEDLVWELSKHDFVSPVINSTYLDYIQPFHRRQPRDAFDLTSDRGRNCLIFQQLLFGFLATNKNKMMPLIDPEIDVRKDLKGRHNMLKVYYPFKNVHEMVCDMKMRKEEEKKNLS